MLNLLEGLLFENVFASLIHSNPESTIQRIQYPASDKPSSYLFKHLPHAVLY